MLPAGATRAGEPDLEIVNYLTFHEHKRTGSGSRALPLVTALSRSSRAFPRRPYAHATVVPEDQCIRTRRLRRRFAVRFLFVRGKAALCWRVDRPRERLWLTHS